MRSGVIAHDQWIEPLSKFADPPHHSPPCTTTQAIMGPAPKRSKPEADDAVVVSMECQTDEDFARRLSTLNEPAIVDARYGRLTTASIKSAVMYLQRFDDQRSKVYLGHNLFGFTDFYHEIQQMDALNLFSVKRLRLNPAVEESKQDEEIETLAGNALQHDMIIQFNDIKDILASTNGQLAKMAEQHATDYERWKHRFEAAEESWRKKMESNREDLSHLRSNVHNNARALEHQVNIAIKNGLKDAVIIADNHVYTDRKKYGDLDGLIVGRMPETNTLVVVLVETKTNMDAKFTKARSQLLRRFFYWTTLRRGEGDDRDRSMLRAEEFENHKPLLAFGGTVLSTNTEEAVRDIRQCTSFFVKCSNAGSYVAHLPCSV